MGVMNNKGLVLIIIRLCIAATFLFAAFPKIEEPLVFAQSVNAYQLLPSSWSLWIALGLPWLELVAGLGILAPRLRRASGCIIVGLLALFIGLHLNAWTRGLDITCGCFGLHEDASVNYLWPILRNLALLIGCILILIRDTRTHSARKNRPA